MKIFVFVDKKSTRKEFQFINEDIYVSVDK